MKIIGKEPINSTLFYSGKLSGYIIWASLLTALIKTHSIDEIDTHKWLAIILLGFGAMITIVSLVNLGKSTRLGIPAEDTELKINGIYKISRNPMYLGFNIFSLSAILFINNAFIAILGIYSIFVYHLIIIGEEKFLESRFSDKYLKYKNKVRRYI